jgi:hypothetical protein
MKVCTIIKTFVFLGVLSAASFAGYGWTSTFIPQQVQIIRTLANTEVCIINSGSTSYAFFMSDIHAKDTYALAMDALKNSKTIQVWTSTDNNEVITFGYMGNGTGEHFPCYAVAYNRQ